MNIVSFFANPSAYSFLLAIIFGSAWLAILKAWQWRGKWLWTGLAGLILFAPSIAWIQIPLQSLTSQMLLLYFNQSVINEHILLFGIPIILFSGIVQELFKMLPVFIFRYINNKQLSPVIGISAGAITGAGYGVFEAWWIFNSIFASGWNLSYYQIYGISAYTGFWERFFTVGFHIALGALTGYGVAKGKTWQFYLLAAGIHALTNYTIVLMQKNIISALQMELLLAVITIGLFSFITWMNNKLQKSITSGSDILPSKPSSSETSP